MARLDQTSNHLNNSRPTNTARAKAMSTHTADDVRAYADAVQDKYDSESTLDTALGSAGYSATQLSRMTVNDKIFALRLVDGLVE